MGPSTGASMAGTPTAAITRARRFGPAAWARIVCISGRIRPPPMPCTTRKRIRLPADQARPQSIEPAVNPAVEVVHIGFGPKACDGPPPAGLPSPEGDGEGGG